MKPQELRIGNYVECPHGVIQIGKFINDGVHFTDGSGGNFASLRSILLTEEWLVKFNYKYNKKEEYWESPNGFKLWNSSTKNKPHFYHILKDVDYVIIKTDTALKGFIHINSELYIHVDYVHHLQNLEFD